MRRRPDQRRRQAIQRRHEPAEVGPGSLHERAEALEAPPRNHRQVSLRDARESSQPCSSRTASTADMSEGSLGQFAAESREFLALPALNTISRGVDGSPPCPRGSTLRRLKAGQ
jgi:hypothetical protein